MQNTCTQKITFKALISFNYLQLQKSSEMLMINLPALNEKLIGRPTKYGVTTTLNINFILTTCFEHKKFHCILLYTQEGYIPQLVCRNINVKPFTILHLSGRNSSPAVSLFLLHFRGNTVLHDVSLLLGCLCEISDDKNQLSTISYALLCHDCFNIAILTLLHSFQLDGMLVLRFLGLSKGQG